MANVAPESSHSPFGKVRELKLLEELASEGWDTRDLCKNLCCVDIAYPSRIPSPFADLADRADRFKHIIGHHVYPQVSKHFNNLQLGGIAKLATSLGEHQPGAFGTFKRHGIEPQFFAVPHDTTKFLLELKMGTPENSDTCLDIRIRKMLELAR